MESTVLDALIGAIADELAEILWPKIEARIEQETHKRVEAAVDAANVAPCEWLTALEAARALGISRKTFARGVSCGTLPQPQKMYGKAQRWSRAAIEAVGRP